MHNITQIVSTTRIDRHGHVMAVSALEYGVRQFNACYVPVWIQHDPRIAPVGRIASARLKALSDGEIGIEADVEVFEPGDKLPPMDASRAMPASTYPADSLEVIYDILLEADDDSMVFIREIAGQLGTSPKPAARKALDPITLVIIGGAAFAMTHVASAFLTRLGEDGYEFLKRRISSFVAGRRSNGKDTLVEFDLVVNIHGVDVEVVVISTNPSELEIAEILSRQLRRIDASLPGLVDPELGIKRLVFEHEEGSVKLRFAVRSDAVPLFPRFEDTDESNGA